MFDVIFQVLIIEIVTMYRTLYGRCAKIRSGGEILHPPSTITVLPLYVVRSPKYLTLNSMFLTGNILEK